MTKKEIEKCRTNTNFRLQPIRVTPRKGNQMNPYTVGVLLSLVGAILTATGSLIMSDSSEGKIEKRND